MDKERKYISEISYPSRVLIESGMPYCKSLHVGHLYLFTAADVFARFMRDRIGSENVLYVSGTDCFGSPIIEAARKEGYEGSLTEYAEKYNTEQAEILNKLGISLDIYEGSAIGNSAVFHRKMLGNAMEALIKSGYVNLVETKQFYDKEAGMLLNGRQVLGRCPVHGCKSERAYADECSVGHQYSPEDLIAPVSAVSGSTPELVTTSNWCVDLPSMIGVLSERVQAIDADENTRKIVASNLREFLRSPSLFVKNEYREEYDKLVNSGAIDAHIIHEPENGKASFEAEFSSVSEREAAASVLSSHGIRFRASKAIVPYRLTGDCEEWSAESEYDGDKWFWYVWPDSLIYPMSTSMAALSKRGFEKEDLIGEWGRYWYRDSDSKIYQFIGEDNLLHYGLCEAGIWHALSSNEDAKLSPGNVFDKPLSDPTLVACYHLLFGKTKASSSGNVKPPSGEELLAHYTPEQLRAHFMSLGLSSKPVAFSPKPFDPSLTDEEKADTRRADPVMKENALLTNVFNRIARSCLYESKNNFDGYMPIDAPSDEAVNKAHETMMSYELAMNKTEFHVVMTICDEFIRYANKKWSDDIKRASEWEAEHGIDIRNGDEPSELRRLALVDAYYLLRIALLLMHPIVPFGCEKIASYLLLDDDKLFNWDADFDGMSELCSSEEMKEKRHRVKELPPKTDFFEKNVARLK